MSKPEVLELYEATRRQCFAAAEDADKRPKLETLEEVIVPLAPFHPEAVMAEAVRADYVDKRLAVFGS